MDPASATAAAFIIVAQEHVVHEGTLGSFEQQAGEDRDTAGKSMNSSRSSDSTGSLTGDSSWRSSGGIDTVGFNETKLLQFVGSALQLVGLV